MSTKEPHKPSRNDLLNELEDIKSSLEREVFGDLLAEANPKDPKQRELEAALEKEVFGSSPPQGDTDDTPPPAEEEVPLLTEVTENIVDLTDISLDDEEELDAEALDDLSAKDEQVEQDLAQVLAEEESTPQPAIAATPKGEEPKTKATVEAEEPAVKSPPAAASKVPGQSEHAAPPVADRKAETENSVDEQVAAGSALPGQQSLFDDPKHASPGRKAPKPASKSATHSKISPQPKENDSTEKEKKSENPFLPAHIRERLNRNHEQSVLEELAQVGDALAKTESSTVATATGEISLSKAESALIDSLVARYLPEIERELRKQLAEKLTKKPVTP